MSQVETDTRALARVAEVGNALADEVGRVLVGKREAVRIAVVCLLSEGHLLIEDTPGTGKTSLAKALAAALDVRVGRIQFTPDLMPSDVTGVSVFDRQRSDFVFRPGPVFANVLLADEINRASPKTQSALLEAMEERQVSVDGTTHALARPFLVLATQNPIDMEGTFPLPEAQRDRFLAQTTIGYPDVDSEIAMLADRDVVDPLTQVRAVADAAGVAEMVAIASQVHIADAVRAYLVRLVRATRKIAQVRLGASPRASVHLARAAKASAALDGRDFVVPDDVARLAVPVLAHRLLLASGGGGQTAAEIVEMVVRATQVPRGTS